MSGIPRGIFPGGYKLARFVLDLRLGKRDLARRAAKIPVFI